jgi:hypothetical protein
MPPITNMLALNGRNVVKKINKECKINSSSKPETEGKNISSPTLVMRKKNQNCFHF